jgi:hypothetical protein
MQSQKGGGRGGGDLFWNETARPQSCRTWTRTPPGFEGVFCRPSCQIRVFACPTVPARLPQQSQPQVLRAVAQAERQEVVQELLARGAQAAVQGVPLQEVRAEFWQLPHHRERLHLLLCCPREPQEPQPFLLGRQQMSFPGYGGNVRRRDSSGCTKGVFFLRVDLGR